MSRSVTVLALLAAIASGCAETGEPAVSSFTSIQELGASDPVTQTFVATNDDLTLVRVWIATYGVPAPSGTLTATLRDDSGPVREVELAGAGLADLQGQSIVFEPVAGSAGRRFELALTWNGVNRVGVLYNEFDAYPDGQASTGGDLRFEVGTSDRLGAAAGVVSSSATELVDRIRRDAVFWGLWLLGLVSLAWLGRRRSGADEPSRQPAES